MGGDLQVNGIFDIGAGEEHLDVEDDEVPVIASDHRLGPIRGEGASKTPVRCASEVCKRIAADGVDERSAELGYLGHAIHYHDLTVGREPR